MFQQVPPTVSWTSCTEPLSMVNVGTEALGMLCNNIVIFHNLKTETKSYFKGDNAQTSAGISLLAGHTRYPLFAIAEAVLRPRIFVMRYPDMEKLTTIESPQVLSYVDLVFSDFGFLAGMTGYPGYVLRLWNYKNGKELASARTYKKSVEHCVLPVKTDVEIVIQYAFWNKQILIWQLCHSPDDNTLKEVATIDLSHKFSQSTTFPISYYDDTYAYVVDDYGELCWIDVAHMSLKPVWSPTEQRFCQHALFYNKTGLLIMNSEHIYFIKRRPGEPPEWQLEWSLDNQNGYIVKLISDFGNNIYGATSLGNIEKLQPAQDLCTLEPFFMQNCFVMDYAILKGLKDEVILILSSVGDLRLVDLIKMNLYSLMNFEEACSICAHNTHPYVAVGTENGRIYFLNYDKPRTPHLMGSILMENAAMSHIRLCDNSGFVVDDTNGVHIITNDFRLNSFKDRISLKSEDKDEWHLLDLFLLDEERALLFISEHYDHIMQYASEAWLYSWSNTDFRVSCAIFKLPYNYRGLTVIQPCSNELVEIMAARLGSNVMDMLLLINNAEVVITYTLTTNHVTHFNCISGTRHIVTSDTQSLIIHLRTHKKGKYPYTISRPVLCTYMPKISVKIDECFNCKYLLVLYSGGCLLAFRLPILNDCLKENLRNEIPKDVQEEIIDQYVERKTSKIMPHVLTQKKFRHLKSYYLPEITKYDEQLRDSILNEIHALEKAIQSLIDFDESVVGYENMNYRKFCLNHKWSYLLEEQAHLLWHQERQTLLAAINDQARIRDWIADLIKSQGSVFSTRLHSLFSNISVLSYTTRKPTQELLELFDLFRFYNMEPLEDEEAEVQQDDDEDEDLLGEEEEEMVERKPLKHYVIERGMQVYEHVMAKDFELQDIKIVSFNQMYNEDAKLPIILVEALKAEFNKRFMSGRNYKLEIFNNLNNTNTTLQKIHSNINCMLCLLKRDGYTPAELSVPAWKMDEDIERILTVDDSEIKAINRRKKIVEAAVKVSKRMLLWSKEFWARALMVMMDGVVEKLWEEEIKKTPLPPEFVMKKNPHEYTLAETRLYSNYENTLELLRQDREKYLVMLYENETKSLDLKKHFVTKLNEHIAEINIWKLKYDFAIKHERLRLLNTKLTNNKRIICRQKIEDYETELTKIVDYIRKYENLLHFFERSQVEFKSNYELQQQRDRYVDRQFKMNFLNQIPQHLPQVQQEMARVYRRRPKLPSKLFSNAQVCFEMAHRIATKKPQKFPLPQELLEFLNWVTELDDPVNCPAGIELKTWEPFTKLRRHKIESELRLKGIGYQVHNVPKNINSLTTELSKLKDTRADKSTMLSLTMEKYFDTSHNQRVELVLTMGQIETGVSNLEAMENAILMHVDDINDVNNLIKEAGEQKLAAMRRVARFRRHVIYTEWRHKAGRANIEYLQTMLQLIEKCKVTYEFLRVLRNWDRCMAQKDTVSRVGYLEDVYQQRLKAARKNLDSVQARIDETKAFLEQKRRNSQNLNGLIDNLKVNITYATLRRDFMGEEKEERKRKSRAANAKRHGELMLKVKRDFAKILELQTILRILRLRTELELPPIHVECLKPIA